MKILVVGGGGREHALIWKLRESLRVEKLWCAPGNGGIAAEAECVPVDAGDVSGLVALAEKIQPDLTIVGPEIALANGLTDAFRVRNWPIVGPSQQAAQLEASKVFSKEFLLRHKIPTAKMYGVFDSAPEALRALDEVPWPLVIKADGLCAGKGVCLAASAAEAKDFIEGALLRNELGPGGRRILLEETLAGDELSFILVTDGEHYVPLVPTRDHKRVFDGNLGPNTGGMGAYSTDDLLTASMRQTILSSIVGPTMNGLAADGIPYQGFLYIGLMLTANGPKVLEFNCRLGDPETQAIVARMDFDLAEVLADAAANRLVPEKLKWKPGASACVVLVSGGYPGKFETGKAIRGLTGVGELTGVKMFSAGTKLLPDNTLATNGGRILGVTAAAPTLEAALCTVYEAAQRIHFDGVHYRRDIGAHSQQPLAAKG
jgi:phosphoribosylamine--glycine ligase